MVAFWYFESFFLKKGSCVGFVSGETVRGGFVERERREAAGAGVEGLFSVGNFYEIGGEFVKCFELVSKFLTGLVEDFYGGGEGVCIFCHINWHFIPTQSFQEVLR